ncbi:MAG: choline dehydrogenase-like flavoprotein, partial [Myxococcota bacterium]
MPDSSQVFDAIVVGSGITGGWAAKELTERGLRVLVIERGRLVRHKDYPTEGKPPWQSRHRGYKSLDRRRLYQEDYPIQSQHWFFHEDTRHFFVKDSEHPYISDEQRPFLWFRGYQLGGRSLTWARNCLRWSPMDFEANAVDGHGVDWPIRYEDVAPWYDHVER